jgi:phosphate transport system permease protein
VIHQTQSKSLYRIIPDAILKRQTVMNFGFRSLTFVAMISVISILVAMLVALVVGAWPAIHTFGIRFFSTTEWNPVTEVFGAVVPIVGTLLTSTIAMVIAVPISFGIAIFLTELSPSSLKRPLGTAIELLAAIPSIIYGMWGLFVFAPFFAKHIQPWMNQNMGPFFHGPPMGIGVLTAGLILAIMIIPFIAATMRDVFELVPPMLKESAYGLGATTWEVVWNIVLPETKTGVIGGIMLGLGRALGETMAVTFVIGNAHNLSRSLTMPGNTISSSLANEFTEAVGELYTASLVELGLVLFIITFVVLAISRLLLMRLKQKEGSRT